MNPDVREGRLPHSGGMTTTTDTPTTAPEKTGPTNQRSFVERAAAAGPVLRGNAAKYDHDGTWVHESFEHIRAAGLLAIAVPTELGGDGATISDVAAVQRELAKTLRLHRTRLGDAPARHSVHRMAIRAATCRELKRR